MLLGTASSPERVGRVDFFDDRFQYYDYYYCFSCTRKLYTRTQRDSISSVQKKYVKKTFDYSPRSSKLYLNKIIGGEDERG